MLPDCLVTARTPASHLGRTAFDLRRYLSVKTWDRGYIVVEAEYDGQSGPVEEYIDLVPILEDLYLDAYSVLAPIEEVLVV